MTQEQPTPFRPDALPPAVAAYLRAQHDPATRAAAIACFAPDARVVDDGHEHVGTDAIDHWLGHEASQFTYTTTYTGQVQEGPDRWTVSSHLEGDFPGGVVDLRLRFRVAGDVVDELVIGA